MSDKVIPNKIKKVVIPAAGSGTRFLPQTKAMPKEMLPVIDKPVIQYVVEEVVASGLKDIIIVTGRYKRAIEDHFDRSLELESFLAKQGKTQALQKIREIGEMANFIYIRQKGRRYGTAVPVQAAQAVIDDDFFVVIWGDEFIWADPPRLLQMLEVFEKYQGAVISAVRIESEDDLARYGIAEMEPVEEGIFRIKKIIEKPRPQEAPSNLAVHGAYILASDIFPLIEKLEPRADGEMCLVKAINQLIETGFPVYATEIRNARYYDTGNKLEYLKTVVDFALRHPELGKPFRAYLRDLEG